MFKEKKKKRKRNSSKFLFFHRILKKKKGFPLELLLVERNARFVLRVRRARDLRREDRHRGGHCVMMVNVEMERLLSMTMIIKKIREEIKK